MTHQKFHLIERIFAALSIPFVVCLVIHVLMGSSHYLSLVRGWPWWTILSIGFLVWHTARELQLVFEDYVKNLCVRKGLIYGVYGGYILMMIVIVWQVMSI